jgi:preprotein translocase subunit YajC
VHTILTNLALAAQQTAAPAAGGDGGGGAAGCAGGGGMQSLVFMLLMFAVFWFILIRPQQKKAKEHQAFLNALKKGDQVITRGGVIGRVSGVADNMVTLEIQEKVRVRVLKSYIEGKFAEAAPAAAAAADKESTKAAPASSEAKN